MDNKGHRAVNITPVMTPSSPALRVQIFEPYDAYPDAKRSFVKGGDKGPLRKSPRLR